MRTAPRDCGMKRGGLLAERAKRLRGHAAVADFAGLDAPVKHGLFVEAITAVDVRHVEAVLGEDSASDVASEAALAKHVDSPVARNLVEAFAQLVQGDVR